MIKERLECLKFDWWDDEAPVSSVRWLERWFGTKLTIYEVRRSWPAVNYIPEDRKGNFPRCLVQKHYGY